MIENRMVIEELNRKRWRKNITFFKAYPNMRSQKNPSQIVEDTDVRTYAFT
jgi:hypothetical protein